MNMQERLIQRFCRYAAVESQSVRSQEVPSTPGQWNLARLLAEDLAELPQPQSREAVISAARARQISFFIFISGSS